MARGIFNKDIEPQCVYCEHGTLTEDKNFVLCLKKGGVMQSYSKCKKFRYDPLKREPKTLSFSADFSKEDFSI